MNFRKIDKYLEKGEAKEDRDEDGNRDDDDDSGWKRGWVSARALKSSILGSLLWLHDVGSTLASKRDAA